MNLTKKKGGELRVCSLVTNPVISQEKTECDYDKRNIPVVIFYTEIP